MCVVGVVCVGRYTMCGMCWWIYYVCGGCVVGVVCVGGYTIYVVCVWWVWYVLVDILCV